MSDQETRVTSQTGGQKCVKSARFDLIDSKFLWELAEVCGYGCGKYSDNNWRKGYSWGLSYGALQRHLHQFLMGEDKDDESNLSHLAHLAWHSMVLFVFSRDRQYKQFDDRLCISGDRDEDDDVMDYNWDYYEDKVEYDDTEGTISDGLSESLDKWVLEASETTEDKKYLPTTENINGHTVTFIDGIDGKEGYIDGRYHLGTAFTSTVARYRRGYETIDEETEALAQEYLENGMPSQ